MTLREKGSGQIVNKKIFVSGCFDMLHSGHVAFFEAAFAYRDLYAGLGSDKAMRSFFADKVYGCKLTGAGGGGYMILIAEQPVSGAVRIIPSAL